MRKLLLILFFTLYILFCLSQELLWDNGKKLTPNNYIHKYQSLKHSDNSISIIWTESENLKGSIYLQRINPAGELFWENPQEIINEDFSASLYSVRNSSNDNVFIQSIIWGPSLEQSLVKISKLTDSDIEWQENSDKLQIMVPDNNDGVFTIDTNDQDEIYARHFNSDGSIQWENSIISSENSNESILVIDAFYVDNNLLLIYEISDQRMCASINEGGEHTWDNPLLLSSNVNYNKIKNVEKNGIIYSAIVGNDNLDYFSYKAFNSSGEIIFTTERAIDGYYDSFDIIKREESNFVLFNYSSNTPESNNEIICYKISDSGEELDTSSTELPSNSDFIQYIEGEEDFVEIFITPSEEPYYTFKYYKITDSGLSENSIAEIPELQTSTPKNYMTDERTYQFTDKLNALKMIDTGTGLALRNIEIEEDYYNEIAIRNASWSPENFKMVADEQDFKFIWNTDQNTNEKIFFNEMDFDGNLSHDHNGLFLDELEEVLDLEYYPNSNTAFATDLQKGTSDNHYSFIYEYTTQGELVDYQEIANHDYWFFSLPQIENFTDGFLVNYSTINTDNWSDVITLNYFNNHNLEWEEPLDFHKTMDTDYFLQNDILFFISFENPELKIYRIFENGSFTEIENNLSSLTIDRNQCQITDTKVFYKENHNLHIFDKASCEMIPNSPIEFPADDYFVFYESNKYYICGVSCNLFVNVYDEDFNKLDQECFETNNLPNLEGKLHIEKINNLYSIFYSSFEEELGYNTIKNVVVDNLGDIITYPGDICFSNHLHNQDVEKIFGKEESLYILFSSLINTEIFEERAYYLQKIDYSEIVATDEELLENTEYSINLYPNPFRIDSDNSISIDFSIPNDSKVKVNIYNLLGQKVKSIANQNYNAGQHQVSWNGKNSDKEKVSSGIYFYQLSVDEKVKNTGKCLLLK